MTEQQWPSMTGWRRREMQARERQRRKAQMADIREARRRNRLREEGHDVEEPEPAEPRVSTAEHESATVPPDYPDPGQMSREELFAYLKSHGIAPGPATKDETLRRKVTEVRDGRQESASA